jgi:hypothetical protein
MQNIARMLKNRFLSGKQKPVFQAERPAALQVIVPGSVVLPLPKAMRDEISVPASINGRDLSTGRL